MYYTYEHWRTDTNVCFYVGKGSGDRAFRLKSRTDSHKAIQAFVAEAGGKIDVKIINHFETEMESLIDEQRLISEWRARGVELINRTVGGAGVRGLMWTPASKAKLSETVKRQWFDSIAAGDLSKLDQLKEMSMKWAGQKQSPKSRKVMSEKAVIRERRKRELGIRQSEETRRKRSEALKRAHAEGRFNRKIWGGWSRPDVSARLAEANRALKGTEEASKRASRAARAGAEKRRARHQDRLAQEAASASEKTG